MKKSDRLKTLFIEQLKKTPIVQIACEKMRVSRASFYRWKEEDPDFSKRIDDAVVEGHLMVNDLAESQLIRAIKESNMTAITYWLKHHHGDYKSRIEINGNIAVVRELSPEQKELVRHALALARVALETPGYEQANTIQTATAGR